MDVGGMLSMGMQAMMGLAGSIAGAVEYKKARHEIEAERSILAEQDRLNTDIFNKEYYTPITHRADVQRIFRVLDENQRSAENRSAARGAINGTTTEQQIAEQEATRKSYADSLAEMASNAAILKDNYMRNYQGVKNKWYLGQINMQDKLAGIRQNIGNQWATAAGNAFGGAAAAAKGLDWEIG